eukprot:CAMPEP_0117526196 /NCGR_PEP_ID=MMETSP0784-20121206/36161_1 /TAXON_ID=39447 /ORGANISM="" /LENGTH=422 /DNA_ID=CAMNT_0005322417 /DNA_START=83 /DNA_END=1348 /DNA_ORIENTATION=+
MPTISSYSEATFFELTRWCAETEIAYVPGGKKAGSKSAERYDVYSVAKTAAEAYRLGSRPEDFLNDVEKGLVKRRGGPFRDTPLDFATIDDADSITEVDLFIGRWAHNEGGKTGEELETWKAKVAEQHRKLQKAVFSRRGGGNREASTSQRPEREKTSKTQGAQEGKAPSSSPKATAAQCSKQAMGSKPSGVHFASVKRLTLSKLRAKAKAAVAKVRLRNKTTSSGGSTTDVGTDWNDGRVGAASGAQADGCNTEPPLRGSGDGPGAAPGSDAALKRRALRRTKGARARGGADEVRTPSRNREGFADSQSAREPKSTKKKRKSDSGEAGAAAGTSGTAAGATNAGARDALAPGLVCRLQGFKRTEGLNGKRVVCTSFDAESGLWVVSTPGANVGEKRVAPDKLVPVISAHNGSMESSAGEGG